MKLIALGIDLLVSFPSPLEAQLRPEIFGHIGMFRAGSDEGGIGKGASFGGTLTLPVYRRLGADLDIQTAKITDITSSDNFYKTRRTLILPTMLYRWGSSPAYGFIGAGVGAEFANSVTREDNFRPDFAPAGWREIKPGVFEIQQSVTWRISFALKGGFTVFPKRRLGVRADFYLANWHMGAKIGLGYRFN